MLNYILKKLLYSLLVVILVVSVIAGIIYTAPIDPTRLTFGQRSDNATVIAKRKELGLDKPLYIQLAYYLNDISPVGFHQNTSNNLNKYSYLFKIPFGNYAFILKKPYLRESYQSGRQVNSILADAIPQTAVLAIGAMIIAIILGIILGVATALHRNTLFESSAMVGSVLGYSLPSYIVAMLLALIFGYWLAPFTGLNIQGSLFEINDLGDETIVWKNVLLPAIALGIRPIALITQLTRSTVLDIISMDFVRTATAKGLNKTKVILQHVLRNALNSVTTALSGWFAGLLAGAFFVENVFAYNGLGQVTVTALLNFDIPVVLGCVIFTSIVFVVINIVVDILYTFLDPRVRLG